MKRVRTSAFLSALFLLSVCGCEGEKAGDPCDKFFQNTCKAPLSCIELEKGKVCAATCDMELEGAVPKKVCKDPGMAPFEVENTKGTTSLGSAGCYCLPK